MEVIYHEKQPTYFILIVVYIIIAGFLAMLVLFPTLFGQSNLSQGARLAILTAVIIDLWLFKSFSRLTVKLTNIDLQIGFGIFKKKFKLNLIQDCLLEDFQKSRYLGYGIRFGRDKSIGYIAKDGQGIRLKLKMGKDYFFTTNNAVKLLALIKQNIKSYTK